MEKKETNGCFFLFCGGGGDVGEGSVADIQQRSGNFILSSIWIGCSYGVVVGGWDEKARLRERAAGLLLTWILWFFTYI